MNYLVRFLGCTLFIVIVRSPATAQDSRELAQTQIDSMQRTILRDSLQLTDRIIREVFTLRNRFFSQSDAVYASKTLSAIEQQNQIKQLRRETDESFRKLLGDPLYQRYRDLIESRMKRWKKPWILPLTLDPS